MTKKEISNDQPKILAKFSVDPDNLLPSNLQDGSNSDQPEFEEGTSTLDASLYFSKEMINQIATLPEAEPVDSDLLGTFHSLPPEFEKERKIRTLRLNPELSPATTALRSIAYDDDPRFIIHILTTDGINTSFIPTYSSSNIYGSSRVLTNLQLQETNRTYSNTAGKYSLVEWSHSMIFKTHVDTRRPFLIALLALKILEDPILFAGCGTGRDIAFLHRDILDIKFLRTTEPTPVFEGEYKMELKRRHHEEKEKRKKEINPRLIGVDQSQEMLDIAKDRIGFPMDFILEDISELSSIDSGSIGAIFCESAITHLTPDKIRKALKRYFEVLKEGGIAFIGFRTKDQKSTHSTYTTSDVFGTRHYSVLTEEEQEQLLRDAGFIIIYKKRQDHPDKNRPSFTNYIIQKPGHHQQKRQLTEIILSALSMSKEEYQSLKIPFLSDDILNKAIYFLDLLQIARST